MNTARPIISTPEAEALSTPQSTAVFASDSNGAGRERRKHRSGAQESSAPGKLGKVVAGQAQEQAVKLTRVARRQATVGLDHQTRRAARIVGALGFALHEAGKQLRADDEQMAASYYDMAGDRIDQLAGTIERQDAEQLLVAVQRFAGRQPIVFFGAAAVLGIVGVRVLKHSSSTSVQGEPRPALRAGAR